MALLTVILFVQEEVLSFLPNIQLTILLIMLYSRCLGFYKTSIIVFVHVILDNLVMGSFNLVFMPFMFIGYLIIPLLLNTCFKKIEKPIILSFISILFAFLYCWIYLIPVALTLEISILDYLVADILFEGLLALSSFLSVLWLYEPLKKVLTNLYEDKTPSL